MPHFTDTQGKCLSFIHAYTDGFGQPPSMQEIADAMNVSTPSVNGMLKTLEKKGLIKRQPGVARSIEILSAPETLPRWKKVMKATIQFWASQRCIGGNARSDRHSNRGQPQSQRGSIGWLTRYSSRPEVLTILRMNLSVKGWAGVAICPWS
ncbi:LexA family protein [Aporhodopirellula aestuarii]|uniref:MarR family transcriptional regulator n=1 Tax=Aporhodopirellula aestuarii TaxID=2950107 RepID=A0ABT0TWK8_9BACT|nr:MarR family transcriptional regulator [Aporhodopirellula aestuarii]MCM2369017.1 MarR family transcriptional regulator [Aporhodopirellula aestuarii]